MGHGHVTPNADGSKARCGGPGICTECSAEASRHPQRRVRMDLATPAELAIWKAMEEVEKLGADPDLTDAVVLLGSAKDKVQDFLLDPSTTVHEGEAK